MAAAIAASALLPNIVTSSHADYVSRVFGEYCGQHASLTRPDAARSAVARLEYWGDTADNTGGDCAPLDRLCLLSDRGLERLLFQLRLLPHSLLQETLLRAMAQTPPSSRPPPKQEQRKPRRQRHEPRR